MIGYILIDLLLFAIVLILYSKPGPFLFDDLAILATGPDQNLRLNSQRPSPGILFYRTFIDMIKGRGQWSRPWLDRLFLLLEIRPLLYWTYDSNAFNFQLNARLWHTANVAIHVVSTWAVHDLLRQWFDLGSAFIGAVIFAVHPLATMSVSYISGRSSSLCAMFMLLALVCAVHDLWLATALMGACALLSKQEALVLPVILGVMAWLGLFAH